MPCHAQLPTPPQQTAKYEELPQQPHKRIVNNYSLATPSQKFQCIPNSVSCYAIAA